MSTVQHLFLAASHKKTLQFGGALDCQIWSAPGISILTPNIARYPERAE
jgi:hypothetical protein